MKGSAITPVSYIRWDRQRSAPVEGWIVDEVPVCIRVHGEPWVTLMASPHDVESLVLGFLRGEGLIRGPEDVRTLQRQEGTCVDVHLHSPPVTLPTHPTLTSGCVGGVTFERIVEELPRVDAALTLSPLRLMALMGELQRKAWAYRRARGIHSAALSDGENLLIVVEDVGRHNTLDRLWGVAMREGIDPAGYIILTSGRISSEMLRKAAKMRVPLIASRTSPTRLALELAHAWGITVVGYVRRQSLRVYTWPQRVREE